MATLTLATLIVLIFMELTPAGNAKQRLEYEQLDDWVAEAIPTINWCRKNLQCTKKKNLMCRRNDPEIVELRRNCFNMQIQNTPRFRGTMLSLHNRLRNRVASGKTNLPGATDMRQLSWNTITEVTAAVWITFCRVGLASCRKTPHSPRGTGQNYFLLGTDTANTGLSKPPPSSLPSFQAWAAALPFFSTDHLRNYSVNVSLVDSFAQLILANSSLLGCSEATYSQSGFYFRTLVCNYDQRVTTGREIYEPGIPCSNCPRGTACNNNSVYPYLCALPDESDEEETDIETDEFFRILMGRGSLMDTRHIWLIRFTQFQILGCILSNIYYLMKRCNV